MRSLTLLALSLAAGSLAACSAPSPVPSSDGQPRRTESPIVFGYSGGFALERTGLVKIAIPRGGPAPAPCSGTLITNRHVLTARHCQATTASTVSLESSVGRQDFGVTAIEAPTEAGNTYDFALLTLDHPAAVDGATNRMSHRIAPSLAVGTSVLCAGYGCSDPTSYGSRCAMPSYSSRWADFSIARATEPTAVVVRSDIYGRRFGYGDDGASCHLDSQFTDGQLLALSETSRIIGTYVSSSPPKETLADFAPPWTTRPWVEARVLAGVTAIYALVPPAPDDQPLVATISAVDDPDRYVKLFDGVPTQVPAFAPRATEVVWKVNGAAQGYLCDVDEAHVDAPLSGDLKLAGTCVHHGVVMAALDAAI